MTRDEIAAIFRQRQEALSRLDAAGLARLHAPDGVVESPFAGGVAHGREAIEQVYRAFFQAFSTLEVQEETLLIDGDRAVYVVHMDGANRGGVMGLPPTGRRFNMSLVSLCELRDGLIARERRIYDFTGLLIQVGAIKVKPV